VVGQLGREGVVGQPPLRPTGCRVHQRPDQPTGWLRRQPAGPHRPAAAAALGPAAGGLAMVPAQRPGLGRPPTPALTRGRSPTQIGVSRLDHILSVHPPRCRAQRPHLRRQALPNDRRPSNRGCYDTERRLASRIRGLDGDSGTRRAPCSAVQVLCGPGQACQRPGGMRLGLESCAVRAAAGGLAVDRRRLAGRDDDRSFPQTDRHRTAEPAPGHGVQARRRLAGPCHRGWSVLPGQQDLSARRRAEANPGGTSSKRLTTTSITRRRPPARRY